MGCAAAAAVVGQKPVVVSEPEIPPKPQRTIGSAHIRDVVRPGEGVDMVPPRAYWGSSYWREASCREVRVRAPPVYRS
jgi:hypothetical protein